ncbi:MAG: triose-phosphate isomerase [Rhodospirillaceae bacterium]
MRRPLIAGNWKMNGTRDFARSLSGDLALKLSGAGAVGFDLLLCPPGPLLPVVVGAVAGSGIAVGGQDCHQAESGAHTGDVAAGLLKDMGCQFVILGHSERRADHGESDALVKAKAEAALAAGLVAVICVGETEAERDAGKAFDVVTGQLKASLPDAASAETVVIAYEPVWAIGTGRTPTVADVSEMHAALRAAVAQSVDAEAAGKMRILYGGSVKPGNAAELLAPEDVDGALVGGASLVSDDFWAIAQAAR